MDDPSLWIELVPGLIAAGVLLLLSAFFSSSETAILSLTKLQVQRFREQGGRASLALVRFVEHPRQLLITVLVGNTFVNIALATLVTSMFLSAGPRALGWDTGALLTGALVVGTTLLLLFGEIAPKTYALRHSERLARAVVLPLSFVSWLLTPIRSTLRLTVDAIARLLGYPDLAGAEFVTPDELRSAISESEATGGLREHERDFIDRIVELREMSARDIMVPRTEMVCVDIGMTLDAALSVARSVGHSRVPIYEGDVDHIAGVLHVKDFPRWHRLDVLDMPLRDLTERRSELFPDDAGTLIRPPLYLPETKRLNALLRDFADERTQMAILLDEYGGTAGLITLEDIVEEITGEIADEYDTLHEPEYVEELSASILRTEGVQLPAKLSLRTASRIVRHAFDTDVADTVGGYVYSLFGRVPIVDETVTDDNGFEFRIAAITGTRIQRVVVRREIAPDAHEDEA
ncbi:HlyC/CorC family transporter [Candidatus Poribacteria bacterium]|nr:HlyC/CorC family transporter [Candidatus Poribacteria bacterium]